MTFKKIPMAAASFLMMSFAALTPSQASAETAVTVSDLNMRSGPGTRFSVVQVLDENTSVKVHGCTASATWCDVGYGYKRGWVSARYLNVKYNDRLVVVTPTVSAAIGISVIKFPNGHHGGHNGGQHGNHGVFNSFKVVGKTAVGCTGKGCGAVNIRPGKTGVTVVGCSDGSCKGVNVKKNRRGKLKVKKFSFGRGADHSQKVAQSRNASGSREAKAGGRLRSIEYSRISRKSAD
ncbi:MAG: SH3 domain-containing protein, partial [Roseibium sp.]